MASCFSFRFQNRSIKSKRSIPPAKDVDGLHPSNVGLLVQGRARLMACTPLGCIEALKRYDIALAGRRVVVVGRSDLVGKPLALLLMHENATVTICHSRTKDLPSVVSEAEIVVAAMGKPALITPEFIREGAVIVDVGTSVLKTETEVAAIFGSDSKKVEDFRAGKNVLVGDVHPSCYPKSSAYTPVPDDCNAAPQHTARRARGVQSLKSKVQGRNPILDFGPWTLD